MPGFILQPVVALLVWSMVMWVWMYATRIPAMNKANIDATNMVGSKGGDFDHTLPPEVQWKAHNYNHLMEQPTLFYATAIVLHLLGLGTGLNLMLAWGYVVLRIVHSLVQVTVNRVVVRFAVFALASLCLIAMIVHAAIAVFISHG
ncbi:MAPEG family protein [Alterisphingorhabdus coralli]|uniref:MAPEG family protein n=1 Tax=Alterisphingorhabdus coralli TaxID=3071408 RepID=A0AA97F459_9SPHN|nr:MAPEG family protein [Parasphingorhabdus sp. SCSIO 66989]WOE73974.1 MAPEG family protein [Parasphingorhabdus sp. SCSIO 66989]